MTSSQTNSLNQLEPIQYPHGTTVINTLQQIAAVLLLIVFFALFLLKDKSEKAKEESLEPLAKN